MTTPWTIQRQGIFKTRDDLIDLDIIDWRRLNGVWQSKSEAMHALSSWFINTTQYTVVSCNLYEYPERGDWPGWDHEGDHPTLGRLYWNAFHTRKMGTITFGDEPDFCGVIKRGDVPGKWFWGDIGEVSASAFALIQKGLHAGELWISIRDPYTQVVLEPLVSIEDMVSRDFGQLAPMVTTLPVGVTPGYIQPLLL